jgi:hypothetical protein
MKKRHNADQIVFRLCHADVELGKRLKVPEVCKQLGISEQTYYRLRQMYGGLFRHAACTVPAWQGHRSRRRMAAMIVHRRAVDRSSRYSRGQISTNWHLWINLVHCPRG